jgi:hypothetical protein
MVNSYSREALMVTIDKTTQKCYYVIVMPQTQIEAPFHEYSDTSEIVSQEQVAGLLEAVANHEIKALALMSMEPGVDYSPTQGRYAVLDLLGSRSEPLVGHSTIKQYNADSFAPNGLTRLIDGGNRFEITEYGETFGRATAGFAGEISLEASDDISLRRLMGLTHSSYPEEKPPYHRYQLLKTLIDGNDHTVMDMAPSFDAISRTTAHRLDVMQKDGLLTSMMRPPRGAQYALLSIDALAKVAARNRAGSVTKEIDVAMKDVANTAPKTVFWTRDVYDHATDNLGYEQGRNTFENVKNRLDRLKDAGVLTLLDQEESREVIYKIRPEIVPIASAFVEMVDLLQNDPEQFVRLGNMKADAILADQALMKKLVAKGREHSPQIAD